MLNKNELQTLTPTELLFLQRHVKQGKGHLEKVLSKEEMRVMFQLTAIPSETHDKLSTDLPELAGVTSLVLNTIMTATLGAWMGLSGFLGLHLNSPRLFLGVFSFAVIVGGFVGFQNARMTRSQARQVIEQRKLQDFEVAILQEVARHRKEELMAKTKEILSLLSHLGIQADVQEIQRGKHLQKTCLEWIDQLDRKVNPKSAEIHKMKEDFVKKSEMEEKKKQQQQKISPIFDKLAHSSTSLSLDVKSWIRTKYQSLLVGLIPTVFGGFSSLFVYLGGGPKLAQEMDLPKLFAFLVRPEIKEWQLATSICITIYFGCCFIYLNRKAFLREQELSKMQMVISRDERAIDLLNDQLLKIKEVLDLVKELFYLKGR